MRKVNVAFLSLMLLLPVVMLNVNADENKTHNVDIVYGSSNVENDRFYYPSIVKIKVGDSVSWTNLDKDPHTVTDGTPQTKWGTVFNSGLMRQGKEYKFKFTEPGEYPYLCALHPWMSGKVLVEDTSVGSVTNEGVNVLEKLNVFIHSEKQSYGQDEIVRFTIDVIGAGNKPIDPDQINAQFGAEEKEPVTLSRIDVGKYVYSTMELKPGSYNLSIEVSKENFASGSSMLTIHVIKQETTEVPKVEGPTISIEPDQKRYFVGDVVTINGSTSKLAENTSIVLQVYDANNKLYTRGQAQVNSEGTFEWNFKVLETAIEGTWTVKTKNFDTIIETSFEIVKFDKVEKSVSDTAPTPLVSVPAKKFKEEKVTIVQASITDQLNSQLYDVSAEQSVMIQSIIKNNQKSEQTFAYIVQIKDSDGIVVKLEAVEGMLPAYKSFTVGVSWTPDQSDNYQIEVFVWKSLNEPVPLSLNILNTDIDVSS